MSSWFYRHSGFRVASELQVPEWAAFEEAKSDSVPDVRIRWVESHAQGIELEASYENAERGAPGSAADECRFFVPEAGEFRVSRTGEIEISAVPHPDMKKVRVFLLGTAWAAFLYLRGLLVLHASVVEVGSAAIAFCGQSGAGKSSLAAQLTKRGCPLVSDDLCRLDLRDPEAPSVYHSSTRLKLWQEALSRLDIAGAALERDHARMDKYHVPLSCAPRSERTPLSAVYVLTWGEPALTRLTGTEALRRLIAAATYRGELLETMGGLARHWTLCTQLVRHVPLWQFTRPRDWSKMDEAADLLLSGLTQK